MEYTIFFVALIIGVVLWGLHLGNLANKEYKVEDAE